MNWETFNPDAKVESAANVEQVNDSQRHPVHFHGSGGEYFGIWIVNLLLTIITLGIYSAWATVRTRKYFYRNTEVAGSRLDFHGRGINILVGRIIAIGLFALYSFGAYIHEYIPLIVLVAIVLLYPWLFVKSQRFRLRNTSWRGIHFDFKADAGDVYRHLGSYLAIMAVLVASFLYFALRPYGSGLFLFFAALVGMMILMPLIYAAIVDLAFNNTTFGDARMRLPSLKGKWLGTYWKTVAIYVAVIASVSAVGGIIGGLVGGGVIDEAFITSATGVSFIVIAYVLFIALMMVPVGYWQARKLNLIFNNLDLDDCRFDAKLKAREFIKLLFTNTLLTVLSLGLAYPWIAVRMARYQLQHIAITGDVDQFSGRAQHSSNALGEEVASVFDLEVGL